MVYRTAGSGPPVVLIHGMVNPSRHWHQVALALANRYTGQTGRRPRPLPRLDRPGPDARR